MFSHGVLRSSLPLPVPLPLSVVLDPLRLLSLDIFLQRAFLVALRDGGGHGAVVGLYSMQEQETERKAGKETRVSI